MIKRKQLIEAGELALLREVMARKTAAETTAGIVLSHLTRRYHLASIDRIDSDTGEIIRGKAGDKNYAGDSDR